MAADELLPDPLPADPCPCLRRGSAMRAPQCAAEPGRPMVVATVGENSAPSARVVLCKRLVTGSGLHRVLHEHDSRKGTSWPSIRAPRLCFIGTRCIGRCDWKDPSCSRRHPKVTNISPDRAFEAASGAWASAQVNALASRDSLVEQVQSVQGAARGYCRRPRRTCRGHRTGAAFDCGSMHDRVMVGRRRSGFTTARAGTRTLTKKDEFTIQRRAVDRNAAEPVTLLSPF